MTLPAEITDVLEGRKVTLAYADFVRRKSQLNTESGFAPVWLPDFLFDFQRALVEWAVRKGRAAIFADCGLGKTPMQLVWAENVVRQTNGRVLILTPLAVGQQTIREATKFGIDAKVSRDGKADCPIVVTNYERLHYFNPNDFSGVVCDESSIMKNFKGRRKSEITEFMRTRPYRLLCTATAAPNDFWELGTSSEALGYLGFRDMITQFFKQEVKKDYLGWGRTKYRFRGHAEQPFWRWVCSWARVVRRPSDMGFSDEDFQLPPLREQEIMIADSTPRAGMLFSLPANDMMEQREELRVTLKERCQKAADLMNAHERPAVIWCYLNKEGDVLARMIDGAKQVSGSMPDEKKEELLAAFQSGQLHRLIIKPKIGCFGLNWQHCHDVTVFPSYSWEQYYQAVRRCWRFGQKQPVTVNIIATQGQDGVMAALRRKSEQADKMFSALSTHTNDALVVDGSLKFNEKEEVPEWLS